MNHDDKIEPLYRKLNEERQKAVKRIMDIIRKDKSDWRYKMLFGVENQDEH